MLFNVIHIPGFTVLSGLSGAATGTEDAAAGMAVLGGAYALSNLIGLILFSPIGYAIGGAIGAVVND